MCELFAFSASHPVQVRYDLDRFAAEGGEHNRNRDGWGVVLADGHDAHYFREAAPASDSPLDRFVRTHAAPHALAIAHVRRATTGRRLLANTHPFRRVLKGRLQHFAHNGQLDGMEQLPEARALRDRTLGDTDSELAFMLLLQRLETLAPDAADESARFDAFYTFCADMARLGPANFLWLDHDRLYVHADRRRHETPGGLGELRAPGLHLLRSTAGTWCSEHQCAGAAVQHCPGDLLQFASVPLSPGPWEPLPRGTALAVHAGHVVHQRSLAL